jgi:pilus assembly protein FimV
VHKSSKFSQFKVLALAATLAAIPLVTNAAGLGRITVLSALGQPLRAQLEVTASRDELNSLTAKLASADAFRVAGIDYVPALSALNFSREVKESNGKRYIEINTDRPLNEPFVDMLVELSWASGRLVREYTFLLDPPELTQKTAPAVVTVPLAGSPLATDQV